MANDFRPAHLPILPARFRGQRLDARTGGSLHAMVVQRLGFLIASGKYKAGEVLPNAETLSAELGVGRSVLREGLKVLSGKGMIEARPKTGMRVRPRSEWNHLDPDLLAWRFAVPTAADAGAIFDLRRAIEPAAARLCARRASEAEIGHLRAILAEMDAAADDNERFAGPDLLFHQSLLRFTGNELIASLASVVEMALLTSFRMSEGNRDGQRHSLPLHHAVLERIAARDEEGARLAVVALLNDAEADVRRALQQGETATRPASTPTD